MKTKTFLLLALAAACLLTACNQKSAEPANITLTVKLGSKIYLSFAGETDSTPVHIRSGRLDTTIIVGTKRTPARYFIANKGKMTIHGRLTLFNCSTNGSVITALDCSRDTLLQNLECNHNALTELNISGCSSLSTLECYDNRLSHIDLSSCSALVRLVCGKNQLTNLDPSKCPELYTIECVDNKLTQLDVTKCRRLQTLYCSDNSLVELRVRGCTRLCWISCSGNKLTELDLSGCSGLSLIYCYKNNLTRLDFSECPSLYGVFCCGNNFSYAATEDLYRSLPDRNDDKNSPGGIFILNKKLYPSGAGNESLAIDKNWNVYWCRAGEGDD